MKNWKKVLSVTLMIGLLMVFLLPSILNYQLPHVETQRLKERKIVRTVMIHAKVIPLEVIRFTFDQPVVVAEYFVKKGRSVGRSIPLFQLSKEAGLPQGVNEESIHWEQRKQEILLALDQLNAMEMQTNLTLRQLRKNVEQAQVDLDESENLFSLGMIAKTQLDQSQSIWEKAKQNLLTAVDEQTLDDSSNQVKRLSLQTELKSIERELEIVDSLVAGFHINEDGEAFSEHSGFVLNKNAENERIAAGVPVLELAMIDDYEKLEMIGTVSVDDLEYIELGMPLEIDTDTENRPFHLEVTDISKLVNHNMVDLTMKMTAEPEGKFAIGTNYTGRIERVLSEENTYAVPISAIVEEDFNSDQMVNIYYLEQEEGLFYDHYFVRELRAKTMAIGDREVLVKIDPQELDLEALEIIINPGYKVYKDARVLP